MSTSTTDTVFTNKPVGIIIPPLEIRSKLMVKYNNELNQGLPIKQQNLLRKMVPPLNPVLPGI